MEAESKKSSRDSNLFLSFGFDDRYIGYLVVYVSGIIDTYTVNSFQNRIETIIGNGHKRLVFDLEDTSFITGSGVGAFVALLNSVNALEGNIILMNMGYKILDIFQLLGITNLFTIIMDNRIQTPRIYSMGSNKPTDEVIICPVCGMNIGRPGNEAVRCNVCGAHIKVRKSVNIPEGRKI